MSQCVFVQIRCAPGTTYKVADDIALKEIHSELYSTSGDYDLLLKLYVPEGSDVGHFVNENIGSIEDVQRTLTTMTFRAF
ncbi:Lrp/AsnC ligand binding domain-containing protein [Tropicimonas sp.]|uniref:Lrp/AsnC ligand binding domain-containing protein n=1 Tax=Tropicimonas sp. TaxID=2067044 RepID=UPI003A841830